MAIAYYALVWKGAGSGPRVPVMLMSQEASDVGVVFTVLAHDRDIAWDEVSVFVTDGLHVAKWDVPSKRFVDTGTGRTANLGNVSLGDRILRCIVADSSMDGAVNAGDKVTILGSPGLYIASMVYEPVDSAMCQYSFRI